MSNAVTKIENLIKEYPRVKKANDISFSIQQIAISEVSGRNGPSKNTTLRVLLPLTAPTAGKIWFSD
jgi:ABC-type Na+ transport system ATPase subunit NatA